MIAADSPAGTSLGWASNNIQQHLEFLEKVIIGISRRFSVEYRSSSARGVKVGDVPGIISHAWIQLNALEKLEAQIFF